MADGYIRAKRGAVPPVVAADADLPVSSPLHRMAGRLQTALPPGWSVRVVDEVNSGSGSHSILRVMVPAE
ncbi:hypothetical protein [Nocardia paucivorans]|uniref:hypothetical protein n=1 Tax=Nocardia paucivorans TaxID=114259 RepID=UPI0002EC83DC|nr:hypothetical protein [Nocardia paucivorans]